MIEFALFDEDSKWGLVVVFPPFLYIFIAGPLLRTMIAGFYLAIWLWKGGFIPRLSDSMLKFEINWFS